MKKYSNTPKEGYNKIICRSIFRNGKRIYAKKGKFFVFWVKDSN